MRLTRLLAGLAISGFVLTLASTGAAAAMPSQATDRFELKPIAHDVGGPIRAIPATDRTEARRAIPLLKPGAGGAGGGGGTTADGALQQSAPVALAATLGVNAEGVNVNGAGTGPCCAPPDANLAVSPTQVVQWVNASFAVFDKTGVLVHGPFFGNSVWSGFGGSCETNNSGDPIVKYDAAAGRWLMTQFAVSSAPYLQCVAVSTTSDITATNWNRYAYSFGSIFPDYPKVGVWPNAYYFSFNLFRGGTAFSGGGACALDRLKAIAGGAATMQCFNLGKAAPSPLPADQDGSTAPANGSTGIFANFGTNTLNFWQLTPQFGGTASITGPTSVGVASFSTACGGGACIPQLGSTQQLDSLGDRLMYRLAYRNFGDHETLVVTHSVKGSGTAAPRWYELRRTTPSAAFSVFQQGSYAPNADYRWMGSAAMDKLGNLAIGFSASSPTINPGIRLTGRTPTDALGTLEAETTLLTGGGSQQPDLSRWGDYSSMVVDPSDDCTFWYTNEYLPGNGTFNWHTRFFSFKFPATATTPGCP